jgi:hypothetical protein
LNIKSVETDMYDLNDAQPQMPPIGDLIPDGTFAKVRLTIRPGGVEFRLVDHAEIPLGDGGTRPEAADGTEGVGRIELGAMKVRVIEAFGRSATQRAEPHPRSSIESLCDPGSFGRSASRWDVSAIKTLMAFCAIASSSGMVRQLIGRCRPPLPSSHSAIAFAASWLT